MAIPPTKFAQSQGGAVAYQVVGDGPVDVLVLKGMSLPVDLMWEEPAVARFLHGLASFSRSVWFDQRGSGSSDGVEPNEGQLLESIVDDMLAVIDALDLERVAVLSLNVPSVPALNFAATHPNRTTRLVLVNPIVRFRRAEGFSVGLPDEVIDGWIASSERNHDRGDNLRLFAPSMADNDRYLRWAGLCARLGTTPGDTRWRMRSSMDADGRALLSSIHVPTMACWQEGAPLTDQHIWVAESIENAQVLVLPASEDRLFFLGDVNALLDGIETFATGGRRSSEAERALMTVMFADIVGSTDQIAVMGDRRWRDVLTTFESVWRAALERFRGVEINTMGDGFVATFDGPGRALLCASAILGDVRSLGVQLRVGLHTGEVELRGADIGGIAVHIAQRIQALAEPGEALVSSTVKDLVAGSDITFSDRGIHQLKGVPESWHLYGSL